MKAKATLTTTEDESYAERQALRLGSTHDFSQSAFGKGRTHLEKALYSLQWLMIHEQRPHDGQCLKEKDMSRSCCRLHGEHERNLISNAHSHFDPDDHYIYKFLSFAGRYRTAACCLYWRARNSYTSSFKPAEGLGYRYEFLKTSISSAVRALEIMEKGAIKMVSAPPARESDTNLTYACYDLDPADGLAELCRRLVLCSWLSLVERDFDKALHEVKLVFGVRFKATELDLLSRCRQIAESTYCNEKSLGKSVDYTVQKVDVTEPARPWILKNNLCSRKTPAPTMHDTLVGHTMDYDPVEYPPWKRSGLP